MKKDDLDLEMEEMLKNARPLSEIDLKGLEETNRAISRDPRHIAAVMKGVFVNDIISAMEAQGINKNQLAEKMGYTRQYLTGLLNREDPRNFTIDTVVKLSVAVGLRPECIRFKPMRAKADATDSFSMLKVAESPGEPYRIKSGESE
jgi:transcriptional regulator with XRE-family HTH domain